MAKLSASAAADRLRGEVNLDKSRMIPPEEQHRVRFLKQVAGHLGIDDSETNLHYLSSLLEKQGIEPDHGHEYPKWVKTKGGREVMVNSPAEETAAARDETPPEGQSSEARAAQMGARMGAAAGGTSDGTVNEAGPGNQPEYRNAGTRSLGEPSAVSGTLGPSQPISTAPPAGTSRSDRLADAGPGGAPDAQDFGDDTLGETRPENADDYEGYARAWIGAVPEAGVARQRWREEQQMRDELGVPEEVRMAMRDELERRLASLPPSDRLEEPPKYEPGAERGDPLVGTATDPGAPGRPANPAPPARPTSDARAAWPQDSVPAGMPGQPTAPDATAAPADKRQAARRPVK
jgi:hypothetical protein